MPELPQVQGFVNYFQYTSLHKKITTIFCSDEDLIENTSCSYLQRVLKDKKFKKVYRKGKYLIAELDNDPHILVMHFGMTGNLDYGLKKNIAEKDKKYAKLIFEFSDHYQLLYNNIRKLGKIYLTTDIAAIEPLKNLGPEPFDLNQKEFLQTLEEHKEKNIKSFLMDQTLIAGIGNEFSNEILYQAEIDPRKNIKQLEEKKKRNLLSITKKILTKAVEIFKKDKDSPKYPDFWLLAHQKDMQCPKNTAHSMKKEIIAGRSAIFCPQHQCK